mmetsp:Transcript_22600/g.42304  ORF Transcript_22600/g.42304 Transcript_22600/m.42304 type:complete len:90 (+) Transcript_22600:262-531(+)
MGASVGRGEGAAVRLSWTGFDVGVELLVGRLVGDTVVGPREVCADDGDDVGDTVSRGIVGAGVGDRVGEKLGEAVGDKVYSMSSYAEEE